MKTSLPLWPALLLLAFAPSSTAFADAPKVDLQLVLQVHGTGNSGSSGSAVAQTVEVFKERLDMADTREPEIKVQDDRISIRVADVDEPDRIRRLLLEDANLDFRFVRFPEGGGGAPREDVLQHFQGAVPDDVEILEGEERGADGQKTGTLYYAVEKKRVVTGQDFESVHPSRDQFGGPMLEFKLKSQAASAFSEETGANVGRGLAIVLNGRVVSSPVVRSRISGRGQIEGNFTEEEIQDLVTVLRSGALPAHLTVLEESRQPSSLETNSFRPFLAVLLAVAGSLIASGLFSRRKSGPGINAPAEAPPG